MITLPAGFDVNQLFNDFFLIATPYIAGGSLLAAGYVILKIFKRFK